MTEWTSRLRDILRSNELESFRTSFFDPTGDDLPDIVHPIDVGADDVLTPYGLEPLQFRPLSLSWIARRLSYSVNECLALRERGQLLETEHLMTLLEYRSQRQSLGIRERLNHSLDEWEGLFASNQVVEPSQDRDPSEHWEIAAETRTLLHKVQEDALDDFRARACADGNAANYPQRFAFIKSVFNQSLITCYRLARSFEAGVAEVFPTITLEPIPEVTPTGYLDALALWIVAALERFEVQSERRSHATFVIPLSDAGAGGLLSAADFKAAVAGDGRLAFHLSEATLMPVVGRVAGANPRIHAVQPMIQPAQAQTLSEAWNVMITLPEQTVGGWLDRPTINVVAPIMPSTVEPVALSSATIGYSSPFGEWTVDVPSNGHVRGSAKTMISNIVMVLELSYDDRHA